MQFKPTQNELDTFSKMKAAERMQYFLSRTIEAEEVWGINDYAGWVLRDIGDNVVLQVWPYKQLCSDYIISQSESYMPGAVSIEHFVDNLLQIMMEQDIDIDIFPTKEANGIRIKAAELYEILNNMLESGEYYMEG